MYDLTTFITIGDKKYHITNDGDFRVILDCFTALDDIELSESERLLASLIIFYEDFDLEVINDLGNDFETAVSEMFKFFNCGQTTPIGAAAQRKLFDWKQDSQLIMSAINQVAHKEVRAEQYVHWWTFMGYFLAIGDCPFAMITTIRNKIVSGKKLEKYEREFKQHNPQYFVWDSTTAEQKEKDDLARQIWNKSEG